MEFLMTVIQSQMIKKCPFLILDQQHYDPDRDECGCTDPDHEIMSDWGYEWNGERWIVPAE